MSKRIQIDKPAPDFLLSDANGQKVSLADFKHKANVLLVFNRGFM